MVLVPTDGLVLVTELFEQNPAAGAVPFTQGTGAFNVLTDGNFGRVGTWFPV